MSKKPSTKDATARSQTRATWIASVVAVIALVVSLLSWYEAHEARVASVRDELILHARGPTSQMPLVFRPTTGGLNAFGSVIVPWDLLLSNTGNSTISITGYKVVQVADQGREVQYSGLDSGLFSGDGKESLPLPMVLEAGKSIRIVAMVGITPGKGALRVLTELLSKQSSAMSVYSIEEFLAAQEIDIYDNTVTPYVSNGKVFGWRVNQHGNEQRFMFTLRTARGTETKELSSWYDYRHQ